MNLPLAVAACVTAFALGATPTANLVAARWAGTDLRSVSTGTVSATNVFRVAGLLPFLLTSAVDVAKGVAAALLVTPFDAPTIAVAAALTVIGHNWSPWLRGAGGRGVLTSVGFLLVAAPAGAALVLVAIVLGFLANATAPACLIAQLTLTPLLTLLSGAEGTALGLALAAPMLLKRLAGNAIPPRSAGYRVYARRLLHDRDN